MRCKKFFAVIIIICSLFVSIQGKVFATNILANIEPIEYTEEFKEWLELEDDEKSEVMMPRMFEIKYERIETYNPLKLGTLLRANPSTKYNLADENVIPENVIVRDQMQTDSCWAFATLSSLETNLALKNKNNGIKAIAYDFSERHVEYGTSRNFKDGTNQNGFNRKIGGGSWFISSTYLTNGTGAISESEMPFENNENIIDISEIQGKTVTSQIYDTIEFPSATPVTITEEMKNQMKNHIKNYGAIYASIHGAQPTSDYYNIKTGAIYCDNKISCPADHAVSIIGWNDEYLVSNFNEEHRPTNPGAWIIKNSWGEKIKLEETLEELKTAYFEAYEEDFIEMGYTEATQIPNSFIEALGYTIEGNNVYLPRGDHGIMYVSYEDVNIYSELSGIIKASDYTDYENIYQYNELGYNFCIPFDEAKIYLANIFTKQTSEIEYLTQVGINRVEGCTCKVYVNPNGPEMSISNGKLQPVELKTGISETLDGAGYHTLEFANPVQINSNEFVVVVEFQGSGELLMESSGVFQTKEGEEVVAWQYGETQSEKCFMTFDSFFEQNEWIDLGEMSQVNPSLPDGDSTIKAFTTSKVDDNTLKEIKVTEYPRTNYFIGENFDKTGMEVTAYYNNGRTNIIDGYDIENGTNLQLGQTAVTIKYQDKSYELPITVEENSAVSINIKKAPTTTQYKPGENFDTTGMVVEATFKDDTTRDITDYTVVDGINIKNGQTTVTIKYGEITTTQEIEVENIPVVSLEIEKGPDKDTYVVGQDFDKTGMIVKATYQDEREIEIIDYTIENGTNLSATQTEVVIKFEDKTDTQSITVEEKAVVSIQVSKMPDKIQYIQNKESLDLTGGKLLVKYNDEAEETILMTDAKVTTTGFSNSELGKIIVTLTYESKETTLELEIIKAETAENSNFNNANCNVLKVQSYAFTDASKEEYIIMELEVENIVKSLKNDSLEYYYYLSPNKTESNIQDWVKIQESQNNSNKLVFKVNTKDINNFQELMSSDVLYLYIKEVAVKGGDQKVAVTNSMLVESHVGIEEYLDGVKQDMSSAGGSGSGNTGSDAEDNTISTEKIPNAGKTFAIVLIITVTASILLLSVKKYKELKEVK